MSNKNKVIYLAGILDGEGHVTIQRSRTRNKRFRKDGSSYVSESKHYISVIGITNTDMRLMNWLKENFGGNFYDKKTCRHNPTWKPSYQWNVGGTKAKEKLLLAILPYLIIKREQAIIALENVKLAGQTCPEKRQELYEKVIALNKKGKTVETNTSSTPHITREWDENWYPICVPECPKCAELKIESDLMGDRESAPAVTLAEE